MENDVKVNRLGEECRFVKSTAMAYVEFNGTCAYCGEDLIEDRRCYALGKIDHLLPKSIYPQYADDQRNLVLACDICNSHKGSFNPCPEGEEPEKMLAVKRGELIGRAYEFITEKENKAKLEWQQARSIILDTKE